MNGPHCPTCSAYEDRVIARKDGEVLPPEVKPCASFVMSDRFREWAVAEMRRDVMGQVKASGLDRMALLKRKDGQPTDADQARSKSQSK